MIFSIIIWTFMNQFENFKTHHNAPLPKCVLREQLVKDLFAEDLQWTWCHRRCLLQIFEIAISGKWGDGLFSLYGELHRNRKPSVTARKYIIQSICQWLDVYKQNYTITYLSSFFSANNKPYFSYVIWNNPIWRSLFHWFIFKFVLSYENLKHVWIYRPDHLGPTLKYIH